MSADFDSPWKEALDIYFEAFLRLLFPHIHGEIDWSRGHESLDKEFQQIIRDVEEENRMPYVSSAQSVYHAKGLRRGIKLGLSLRFGRDGLELMPEIEKIYDEDCLESVLKALETEAPLDEIRRIWEKPAEQGA